MFSSFNTFQAIFDTANTITGSTQVSIPNKMFYYTFENTNGTTINNEWGGTINSTASTSALISTSDFKEGSKSAQFTGQLGNESGYRVINVPYNTFYASFNRPNGVSFSFWIKRTGSISSETHVMRWISSNYSSFGGCAFYYNGTNGRYGWGSVWTNANTFNLSTDTQWTHIVLTATTTNLISVYVNGTPVNNINGVPLLNITHGSPPVIPNSSTNNANDFWFGGFPTGTAQRGYNGFIDELKCYNKVLTQTEITAIYNKNDIKLS